MLKGPSIEPNLPAAPETTVDPETIGRSKVPIKFEALRVPSIVPNLPIEPEIAVEPETIPTTKGSGTVVAEIFCSLEPSP